MYCIGQVTPLAKRLVNNVYESMWQGHSRGETGRHPRRYRPCRPAARRAGRLQHRAEYCGHGIGREREEPAVLPYGQPGSGLVLQEAWCSPSRPMISRGDAASSGKTAGRW
ncbi:hypothetical protein M8494_19020 [Serratia ureilytica]